MKRTPHFVSLRRIPVLIGGVITLLTAASCSRPATSSDDSATPSSDDRTVAVTKVVRGDISKFVTLTAEFFPWQQVEVHAKVSGYVQKMNVDVGDHAKTGDVLAVLEIPEIDQELNQAKASILSAQQEVKSIEAEFDETTLLASRINEAANQSKGLIAQQDIDNANDTNRANEAKLAAAKQQVAEAQANEARLQALVDYAQVTAPFDGVVTRRYADTGALVQAGTVQSGTGSNSNSMPMVSFAQLNLLRLEFPVPEANVPYVHVGDSVDVDVLSMGKTFRGKSRPLGAKGGHVHPHDAHRGGRPEPRLCLFARHVRHRPLVARPAAECSHDSDSVHLRGRHAVGPHGQGQQDREARHHGRPRNAGPGRNP